MEVGTKMRKVRFVHKLYIYLSLTFIILRTNCIAQLPSKWNIEFQIDSVIVYDNKSIVETFMHVTNQDETIIKLNLFDLTIYDSLNSELNIPYEWQNLSTIKDISDDLDRITNYEVTIWPDSTVKCRYLYHLSNPGNEIKYKVSLIQNLEFFFPYYLKKWIIVKHRISKK